MIKQISVSLENSPGRLLETIRILGEAGINLRALSLNATTDFGVARLLVSNVAVARRIMMEKHVAARIDEVVVAELDDKPRSLEKLLEVLVDAHINLNYLYAVAELAADKALMVFSFGEDDARAIKLLKEQGVKLLGPSELGIEENGQ